jgi:hypothetical protein
MSEEHEGDVPREMDGRVAEAMIFIGRLAAESGQTVYSVQDPVDMDTRSHTDNLALLSLWGEGT